MKTIVVGGTFTTTGTGRSSKIIDTLSKWLGAHSINGGNINKLLDLNAKNHFEQFDLIIWAPNISNEIKKVYPTKKKGSVLICSKNLYNNKERSEIDAVSRIFSMHGNAVIAIKKDSNKSTFKFKLIDALGNVWVDTNDITYLAVSILKLYIWSSEAERRSLSEIGTPVLNFEDLQRFLEINKKVASKCQKNFTERYFGNLSTRCAKMFPSCKSGGGLYLFSARNTNKESITLSDMVFVKSCDGQYYYGDKKPSVDTPVQLKLYEQLKEYGYNYMIHGHAYIEEASFTKNYYPCGDMREASEIINHINNKKLYNLLKEHEKLYNLLKKQRVKNEYTPSQILKACSDTTALNLINHGFIIMSKTLDSIDIIVENFEFKARGIEPRTEQK